MVLKGIRGPSYHLVKCFREAGSPWLLCASPLYYPMSCCVVSSCTSDVTDTTGVLYLYYSSCQLFGRGENFGGPPTYSPHPPNISWRRVSIAACAATATAVSATCGALQSTAPK